MAEGETLIPGVGQSHFIPPCFESSEGKAGAGGPTGSAVGAGRVSVCFPCGGQGSRAGGHGPGGPPGSISIQAPGLPGVTRRSQGLRGSFTAVA